MPVNPARYYNRFDPANGYDQHLFIAGRGLQSAELNEVQHASRTRLRDIADAIFKDGDIVRDASMIVDPDTGVTQCASGAIYIAGAVRGVSDATFTIPIIGEVAVGIRMLEVVVTALEDPTLLDPATGTRYYNQRGAERMRVDTSWGWDGDGQPGDFYPVYGVIDGVPGAKEVPPVFDAVSQALARYDRDSAGGTYVVRGLDVTRLEDNGAYQVYSVAEGRARVYGYAIDLLTSRRSNYAAVPDLKAITNEPHLSSTAAAQRINFDRSPATDIVEVTITEDKSSVVTHGVISGGSDPIPDTSVLSIISVVQGGTTYTPGTDYLLTAGQVDWSPGGAEPAPGSTYTVRYLYLKNVVPTDVDDTGFTVTGAVVGTLVQVSYSQKLPRYDVLCITAEGNLEWIAGVAAEWNPIPPQVPPEMLALATVYQSWSATSVTRNDGVRVVPMQELATIGRRIDFVLGLVAQQRLENSATLIEAGQKKGVFVDPFLSDDLRDAGLPNTAAVFDGTLTLAVDITSVASPSLDVTAERGMAYTMAVALQQLSQTGNMKVNPYMAFDPLPAAARLTPAIDRWTQIDTVWASPLTRRVIGFDPSWHGSRLFQLSTTVSDEFLSAASRPAELLRPITVAFQLDGFGAGEILSSVTFDGVPVVAA